MGRTVRMSRLVAMALAIFISGVYEVQTLAASEGSIVADLDGKPIPAVEVGLHQCDDLDFPLIHCYATAADLERAVTSRLPTSMDAGASAFTTLAASYVRVFADASYQGASAYLSVAYDDLSVIGWNDRISSFQGLTGGGTFFVDAYQSGAAYNFSANQWVTYVGDALNDKFSSVRPR